jgi:hypothetical protein
MASQRAGKCGGLHCTHISSRIWYCVDCGCYLCAHCWKEYPPHTSGRTGRDGLQHEQTKYETYQKLESILTPSASQSESEERHSRDLDSTWFGTWFGLIRNARLIAHYSSGIRKDNYARPVFADYDVYSTLMGNPLTGSGVRLPQLASFIGQTSKSPY